MCSLKPYISGAGDKQGSGQPCWMHALFYAESSCHQTTVNEQTTNVSRFKRTVRDRVKVNMNRLGNEISLCSSH